MDSSMLGGGTSSFLATSLTIYVLAKTSDYWMPERLQQTFKSIEVTASRTKRGETNSRTREHSKEHWTKDQAKQAGTDQLQDSNSGYVTTLQARAFSIPIPFWNRRKPGRPFTPDDPEWKEFETLQTDKKRLRGLRDTLAVETLKEYISSKGKRGVASLQALIQDRGTIRVNEFMIVPPLRAPDVYQNLELLITPRGTRWHWRTLPDGVGDKLERIQHVKVLSHACWRASGTFFVHSYSNMKASFYRVLGQKSPTITYSPERGISRKSEPDSTDLEDETFATTSKSSLQGGDENQQDLVKTVRKVHQDLADNFLSKSAIQAATEVFQTTLLRGQKDALVQGSRRRDACVIRCTVDFLGRRGRIRNDVRAVYIPARDLLLGPVVIVESELIPNLKEWADTNPPKESKEEWMLNLKKADLEQKRQLLTKIEEEIQKNMQKSRKDYEWVMEEQKKLEEMLKRTDVKSKKVPSTREKAVESDETAEQAEPSPNKVARVAEMIDSTDGVEKSATAKDVKKSAKKAKKRVRDEEPNSEDPPTTEQSDPTPDISKDIVHEAARLEEQETSKKSGRNTAKDSTK